jgi:hypothetical protein
MNARWSHGAETVPRVKVGNSGASAGRQVHTRTIMGGGWSGADLFRGNALDGAAHATLQGIQQDGAWTT